MADALNTMMFMTRVEKSSAVASPQPLQPARWAAKACETLHDCIDCLLPWLCLNTAACTVQEASNPTSLGSDMDEGCIATVVFEFLQHPEWLQEGARLIVHDRTDNCLSGAGFVRRLFWQP